VHEVRSDVVAGRLGVGPVGLVVIQRLFGLGRYLAYC
jgi:hypothetical protein